MTPLRKRLCILGATGSIGEKTLQVVRDFPDLFEVTGLSAHASSARLAELAAEFRPKAVALTAPDAPWEGPAGVRLFRGEEGVQDLLEASDPGMVVVAMVGAAGLLPTLKAIDMGRTIALANKEVLVTAGPLTMARAGAKGVTILPIDSEHNAIFQCLHGDASQPVRRVVLTASGGPFRGWSRARLETATLEDALRHPTWRMGRKITIDSATLMNKGFEVIEGAQLFGLPVDRFEVVVHPQSLVHSLVEFVDGSVIAQMCPTDMYFPIAHVLAHPRRLENRRFPFLDFVKTGTLSFEAPDPEAFPCLGLAIAAAKAGGTHPAVLNAANEVAVERFLAGELRFVEIPETIEAALTALAGGSPEPGLEEIREADRLARAFVRELSPAGSPVRN